MTFDGDDSGLAVADLLIDAATHRGVDVRLLVDCFALRYVSDTRATERSVTVSPGGRPRCGIIESPSRSSTSPNAR